MSVRALVKGWVCLLALAVPVRNASAEPLRYHLTLDAARAVHGDQTREFGWGAGIWAAGEAPLIPQLGLEVELGALWLSAGQAPANSTFQPQGAAHGISAALGLRTRPFAGDALPATFSLSGLWLASGVGMVSTKDLLRPTIRANLGYDVRVSEALGLGPNVGYFHILQPDSALRPDDAGVLLLGVHGVFGNAAVPAPREGDRDLDGILDEADGCPDKAEDKDGFKDQDGCPELDNDQDGVPDVIDKCPNVAEDKDGFQDADGCADPDNDQDGLVDAKDKCPSEPEDKDDFEDADGCADPDNDQDTLLDPQDQCPFEPETLNGYADTDGCPDEQDIRVVGDKIVLDDRVHFWKNSHLIRRESDVLLARIAKLIQEHPEYIHIEVEGHSDRRGPDSFNKPLSERRAEEVVKALVKNGVVPWRLSSQGFGEEQPLVEGESEYAMWLNRRVDFRITRRPLPPKAPEVVTTSEADEAPPEELKGLLGEQGPAPEPPEAASASEATPALEAAPAHEAEPTEDDEP